MNDLIDFTADGIGEFRARRRTMRLELAIAAEFARLTEGVEKPTEFLALVAGWISQLKVLTVSAPDGWDILAMDPLEDDTYSKLAMVYAAFRDAETKAREGAA
ncbi:hypothetical protein [Burkholderia multivorans]|uniref:hypothetical protein n=1 Tax=Burkholderia multivorans TaxID=87883 RepID=UPI0019CF84E4|nr:hypothetical protein [Burkholderia multivorans]MBN6729293.1 hypothetical protein [Burkholderia multivorans]MBN6737150.1 hypothetical protein [Burkholderia multivorans]MBN7125804.1 hypothetical protein [Burkholderia multivorans]MBN8167632.1 hypothetical protein [Burkholderia multivorans]QSL25397.1 hypothetical protein G0D92_09440 [Burkholderia multivorans]